jgi:integrase
MQQYTLSYALNLCRNSNEAKMIDANFQKYLSIVLRQYVLPKLDPSINHLAIDKFDEYSDKFLVVQLKDALSIFETSLSSAIKNNQVSVRTGSNYRSALKRFLGWLEKQAWWPSLFPDPIIKIAPFRPKITPKPGTGTSHKLSSYSLLKGDMPEYLLQELEEFKQFRITGGSNIRRTVGERRQHREEGDARKPKIDPIKPSTFNNDEQSILCFLGWYKQQYPDLELHLELLTDVDSIDRYTIWAVENRSVSHSTGVSMAKTAIAIAKWLNYGKSTRRNWSDVQEILDLKDLRNEFAEKYKKEKQHFETDKWALKELTHEEAREVVEYLRKMCAPYIGSHYQESDEVIKYSQKRDISAVTRTWQTYLIVKIFVYCPVRQEEVRNLKLGETLFREEDEYGNPYYVVKLDEHKRSTLTGKLRHYRLPTILTEDLDLWIYKWRPIIEESIKTSEGWMKFWCRNSNSIERCQQKLESIQQGIFNERIKTSPEKYVNSINKKLKATEQRLAVWSVAKNNFESHNHLFFMFGKNRKNGVEVFGNPQDVSSIWRVVTRAIATASKALWGEERWTNPHTLRHIAEKHIRRAGNPDITEAFGMLIGHSKEVGDEYARQITSDYEETEGIVDDWWQELEDLK